MAKPLVSDELWDFVEPLIPVKPRRYRHPGRKPIHPRQLLTGILFVLKSGMAWKSLPVEMGCGSGETCRRALEHWCLTGVWDHIHHMLLQRLADADRIDWSRACLDSTTVPAALGGEQLGPNPTDRGKPGSKVHLVTERTGIPLASSVGTANEHDSMRFEMMVDAIPPLAGRRGRPRRRPEKLHADKGYDYPKCRRALHHRRIKVRIARRGIESSTKLGRHRWVIERTIGLLKRFRRLRVRYDRRAHMYQSFVTLGCIMLCWNALVKSFGATL